MMSSDSSDCFYKFNQETLNVPVGGSMGLWLGLSVVQGVQLLGNLVSLFRNLPEVLKDHGLSHIGGNSNSATIH